MFKERLAKGTGPFIAELKFPAGVRGRVLWPRVADPRIAIGRTESSVEPRAERGVNLGIGLFFLFFDWSRRFNCDRAPLAGVSGGLED